MFARSLLILIAFAVNGIALGSQAVPASRPNNEFSLTLSASQLTVRGGGPVVVTVTVTNISGHVIGVEEDRASSQEHNYKVTVRGEHGEDAPTTAYHRMLRGQPSQDDPEIVINSSELLVPLDPGKTLTDSIDLTKLYSLKPGVYSIEVERTFDNQVIIHSNTLMITVTAGAPDPGDSSHPR
jgi:hypothetical protein